MDPLTPSDTHSRVRSPSDTHTEKSGGLSLAPLVTQEIRISAPTVLIQKTENEHDREAIAALAPPEFAGCFLHNHTRWSLREFIAPQSENGRSPLAVHVKLVGRSDGEVSGFTSHFPTTGLGR